MHYYIINYYQNYYLLNKEYILQKNKDYRVKTNYNKIYNNTLIKCKLCNKKLKQRSMHYHMVNKVCLKTKKLI